MKFKIEIDTDQTRVYKVMIHKGRGYLPIPAVNGEFGLAEQAFEYRNQLQLSKPGLTVHVVEVINNVMVDRKDTMSITYS